MLKSLALIAAVQMLALLAVVTYMLVNPEPSLPDVGAVPAGQHCWQEVNKEMPTHFEKICADNATFIPHIEEDQPGWNCLTMGNHICGPDIDISSH
jgi:hypothetical protein